MMHPGWFEQMGLNINHPLWEERILCEEQCDDRTDHFKMVVQDWGPFWYYFRIPGISHGMWEYTQNWGEDRHERDLFVVKDPDSRRWLIRDASEARSGLMLVQECAVMERCLTRWGARRKAEAILSLPFMDWISQYHNVYINPPLSFVPEPLSPDDDE